MTAEKRYYGLAPLARFRRELGFVFVDDGQRTFQLSESLFFQILGSSGDGAYSEGAMAYSSVFQLFSSPEKARQSVQNKEI